MKTKYGDIPDHQINSAKKCIRKSIFYLLLYADPQEKIKYPDVDINKAFANVFYQLMGFNKILLEPPEILLVMSILESAQMLYNSANFDFHIYRKLILDAGSKIMQVAEDGERHGDH